MTLAADDAAFIARIIEAPQDDAPRLVYADGSAAVAIRGVR